MGQDKTPDGKSSEESPEGLLTPPTTNPSQETHASRSGTSPPPTDPPSYFDRGQPGFREPLPPRGRTPLFRAPGFVPRPQSRVQRPSSTPLRDSRRINVHESPHRRAQRASSHQTLQPGNKLDGTDVEKLVPGRLIGAGDTQPNYILGHIPALPASRPPLLFGPPIASQQPPRTSDVIPIASVLAASQFRGQTRASRTTSSRNPEFVFTPDSYTSPYEQQEPDEPATQDGHRGAAVATNAVTCLARREEQLWNGRGVVDYRGAHECQLDRTVLATNGASRRRNDSHAIQGDKPSNASGQHQRSVEIPQPRSGNPSTLLDVQSASKRPRSGNSSPTDQPATQRPRTSVTESSRSNQLHLPGVGGSTDSQPRSSVAPSASFSVATLSRRTNFAASPTPDPATRTSPPRVADVGPPRPSNVFPPNPRRSTSTPRPNADDSGHRRPSQATPPRPVLSTSTSPTRDRHIDVRQARTSTPPVPRSSSNGSASPASRNATSGRVGSRSTSLSSRPNSHSNISNDRRSSTPASSESPPSAPSQADATSRRTDHVWDEGFDYWSLSVHQRTTYRHGLSSYLTTTLRQGQGSIPNANPSRPYRENNPEDPRIECIMDGLRVTREEAIGMILGSEEVRKQAARTKSTARSPATDATVDTDEHTTPLKRPGTERRFREEMARLHPPSNNSQDGHRRNASQPPPTSPTTTRPRPRSRTIVATNQPIANDKDDGETENSASKKGTKRGEQHLRCHLPPDPTAPFQHPLTKPPNPLFHPRLDDISFAPYKSLDLHNLTLRKAGFRTVDQYDALCKSLHEDCKRGFASTPVYLDSGMPFSAGYCLSGTQRALRSMKGRCILAVSVMLGLLLVCGGVGVGSVVAGVVVLAVFLVWVLLL